MTYLTKEGLQKLQEEYDELQNVRIPHIASRIDEARQQGDLSENAEYHAAREDMAWAQTRLEQLEEILRHVEVIHGTGHKTVSVGSTVKVVADGKNKEFKIVGAQESNPTQGYISNESPLGQRLLGAAIGDEIEVKTPAGVVIYKVVDIL